MEYECESPKRRKLLEVEQRLKLRIYASERIQLLWICVEDFEHSLIQHVIRRAREKHYPIIDLIALDNEVRNVCFNHLDGTYLEVRPHLKLIDDTTQLNYLLQVKIEEFVEYNKNVPPTKWKDLEYPYILFVSTPNYEDFENTSYIRLNINANNINQHFDNKGNCITSWIIFN